MEYRRVIQNEQSYQRERVKLMRDFIENRKQQKKSQKVLLKTLQLQQDLETLTEEYKHVVSTTGLAHKLACDVIKNNFERCHIQAKKEEHFQTLRRQRAVLASNEVKSKRLEEEKRENKFMQTINEVHNMARSHREDAHNLAESKRIKNQKSVESMVILEDIVFDKTSKVLQSANSPAYRGSVAVNVKVIKHIDKSCNLHQLDQQSEYFKKWKFVMNELVSRKKSIKRAKVAYKVIAHNRNAVDVEEALEAIHQMEQKQYRAHLHRQNTEKEGRDRSYAEKVFAMEFMAGKSNSSSVQDIPQWNREDNRLTLSQDDSKNYTLESISSDDFKIINNIIPQWEKDDIHESNDEEFESSDSKPDVSIAEVHRIYDEVKELRQSFNASNNSDTDATLQNVRASLDRLAVQMKGLESHDTSSDEDILIPTDANVSLDLKESKASIDRFHNSYEEFIVNSSDFHQIETEPYEGKYEDDEEDEEDEVVTMAASDVIKRSELLAQFGWNLSTFAGNDELLSTSSSSEEREDSEDSEGSEDVKAIELKLDTSISPRIIRESELSLQDDLTLSTGLLDSSIATEAARHDRNDFVASLKEDVVENVENISFSFASSSSKELTFTYPSTSSSSSSSTSVGSSNSFSSSSSSNFRSSANSNSAGDINTASDLSMSMMYQSLESSDSSHSSESDDESENINLEVFKPSSPSSYPLSSSEVSSFDPTPRINPIPSAYKIVMTSQASDLVLHQDLLTHHRDEGIATKSWQSFTSDTLYDQQEVEMIDEIENISRNFELKKHKGDSNYSNASSSNFHLLSDDSTTSSSSSSSISSTSSTASVDSNQAIEECQRRKLHLNADSKPLKVSNLSLSFEDSKADKDISINRQDCKDYPITHMTDALTADVKLLEVSNLSLPFEDSKADQTIAVDDDKDASRDLDKAEDKQHMLEDIGRDLKDALLEHKNLSDNSESMVVFEREMKSETVPMVAKVKYTSREDLIERRRSPLLMANSSPSNSSPSSSDVSSHSTPSIRSVESTDSSFYRGSSTSPRMSDKTSSKPELTSEIITKADISSSDLNSKSTFESVDSLDSLSLHDPNLVSKKDYLDVSVDSQDSEDNEELLESLRKSREYIRAEIAAMKQKYQPQSTSSAYSASGAGGRSHSSNSNVSLHSSKPTFAGHSALQLSPAKTLEVSDEFSREEEKNLESEIINISTEYLLGSKPEGYLSDDASDSSSLIELRYEESKTSSSNELTFMSTFSISDYNSRVFQSKK